ncbi:MAG: hypothetical protein QGF00_04135 [Planctomycetota bacterium]|jgi:hypothetical protein|nr:hypothetical protein [Planctomycetota bacterium]MDP7248769.1 hypothetical protein [Planctomycetota bacterium]
MNTESLFINDVHPRLFFSPEDVPSLRDKAKHGIASEILREMQERCERYCDPSSPQYVDPSLGPKGILDGFGSGQPSNGSDALHCLTFAYLFEPETRWLKKAEDILRGMLDGPFSDIPNPDGWGVCYATIANQVTFAFDILHNELDDELRTRLYDFLRVGVVERIQKKNLRNPAARKFHLGVNTWLRLFEKYVVALGATYRAGEDGAAVFEAEKLLRQSFHHGMDEGSAIHEGYSYGWRDAEWMSFSAEVLLRMGAANLWNDEPRFANLGRQWLYVIPPGRRGINSYADMQRHKGGRPPLGMLLAARRLGDPALWWGWDQLGGRGSLEGHNEPLPKRITWNSGLVALWEDDDAEVKSPGDTGYSLDRHSGRVGLSVMRSGWEDDDLYFSLMSSGRAPGCLIHQHADSGHFSLFALGEAFSIETGYADIKAMYHSVMMPDSAEPPGTPEGFDQMFFGGRTEAFASAPNAAYACAETTSQWRSQWAYRHGLVIRAEGAEPYALLLDNMNHGPEFRNYLWLMNSENGNRIEIDPEKERATVLGKKHRCEIAWNYPADYEYPEPHRLELDSDEIDSLCWLALDHKQVMEAPPEHPISRGATGLGYRPRLKANLWGYNGQLLSALLPRRADQGAVEVERLRAPDQIGMTLRHGEVTDTVIASPHQGNIDLADIEGEARIVVVRRDNAGEVIWWCAVEAYEFNIEGRTVIERAGEAATLRETES